MIREKFSSVKIGQFYIKKKKTNIQYHSNYIKTAWDHSIPNT